MSFSASDISAQDAAAFTTMIRDKLFYKTKFPIIDSQRAELTMKRKGMLQTSCTDEHCARKAADALQFGNIIFGQVSRDNKGIRINLHLFIADKNEVVLSQEAVLTSNEDVLEFGENITSKISELINESVYSFMSDVNNSSTDTNALPETQPASDITGKKAKTPDPPIKKERKNASRKITRPALVFTGNTSFGYNYIFSDALADLGTSAFATAFKTLYQIRIGTIVGTDIKINERISISPEFGAYWGTLLLLWFEDSTVRFNLKMYPGRMVILQTYWGLYAWDDAFLFLGDVVDGPGYIMPETGIKIGWEGKRFSPSLAINYKLGLLDKDSFIDHVFTFSLDLSYRTKRLKITRFRDFKT